MYVCVRRYASIHVYMQGKKEFDQFEAVAHARDHKLWSILITRDMCMYVCIVCMYVCIVCMYVCSVLTHYTDTYVFMYQDECA